MNKLFDQLFVRLMDKWGIKLLRWSLGLVFAWFGLLKLFGVSPVVKMVSETYGFLPVSIGNLLILLGILELLIGLCLLFKIGLRLAIFLLWVQMLGTFYAVFLAPSMFYGKNLFFLTMEGEFVAKNLVLVAASLAVGAREISR